MARSPIDPLPSAVFAASLAALSSAASQIAPPSLPPPLATPLGVKVLELPASGYNNHWTRGCRRVCVAVRERSIR